MKSFNEYLTEMSGSGAGSRDLEGFRSILEWLRY